MDKPFYLQGSGPNLITPKHLNKFSRLNPQLDPRIKEHNLELRILDLSYLESFCAWVLSQQISGKVAEIFLGRFRELIQPITPDNVLSTPDSQLRDIGLSKTKVTYVKNIASFFLSDQIPDNHDDYTSEDLLRLYKEINGVGDWTVNMFLIFNLGRLDVRAPKDLVVRKGMQILYQLGEIPTVREARQLMESWGDLGTIGCILSWAVMGE